MALNTRHTTCPEIGKHLLIIHCMGLLVCEGSYRGEGNNLPQVEGVNATQGTDEANNGRQGRDVEPSGELQGLPVAAPLGNIIHPGS